MTGSIRLTLVAVGLAVAVYGVASLTGGWLGTPPWWTRPDPESASVFAMESTVWVRYQGGLPREGREWISAGAVVAGIGLIAAAIGLHGRHQAGSFPGHVGRTSSVVLGLAAAACGVMALTGELRGIPQWSDRYWPHVAEREEVERGAEEPLRNRLAPSRLAEVVTRPPFYRGWFSSGVIAAGLALTAVGVWPRRRRTTAES